LLAVSYEIAILSARSGEDSPHSDDTMTASSIIPALQHAPRLSRATAKSLKKQGKGPAAPSARSV